jgi:hypothetical protein
MARNNPNHHAAGDREMTRRKVHRCDGAPPAMPGNPPFPSVPIPGWGTDSPRLMAIIGR